MTTEANSIPLWFFRSETSQRIRADGEAKGRAEDIIRILEHRGVPVSDSVRGLILSCREADYLDSWFDRSLVASTMHEVFLDTPPYAEGFADGLAKAEAKVRAKLIVHILERREVQLSEADRERILACWDPEELDRWFDRSISATTVDEVFAQDG
ncbi:hypothetical protein [Nocardia brasiliensis]|uniref:hypothetical protein n=1 Tax=Nocardia brasiliensis TaxID=37326 RepID=UPI0018952033|nr:hypothetical protein [Nocardia brasiliensis]MBF6127588.1 hypothetical protein [Nocardia brasiliensis]